MSMNDDLIRDIYQRLGGIEAKIDDVKSIRITADNAQAIANRAEQKSDTNAKDIEDIRDEIAETKKEANANKRWLIGTIITTVLALAGLITTIVISLL